MEICTKSHTITTVRSLILAAFLLLGFTNKSYSQVYGQSLGSVFKGVNWAAIGDNYSNGDIYISGFDSSFSYNNVVKKTDSLCTSFRKMLNANTLRLPINPATVLNLDSTGWWHSYRGAVDQATSMGMKVLLCCWEGKPQIGMARDTAQFFRMWDSVVNQYKNNGNVYFEIMNEPFGYKLTDWKNLCKKWLNKYPNIRRNRVFIGGTGYDEKVASVAIDPAFNGCIFSRHIYAFWANIPTVSGWVSALTSGVVPYEPRTVVTEFGTVMSDGIDFNSAWDTTTNSDENCKRFMIGVTNQIDTSLMGAIYWPGLRTGDGYSVLGIMLG